MPHFGALALSTSAFAAGVTVGDSALINFLDYSDTFTGTDDGGNPDRPYIPAVQPPAAYVLENTYGNPGQSFQIGNGFSFTSDNAANGNPGLVNGNASSQYPFATNSSGAGSDTGFTQTGNGGVDYGINYGLRDEYVVQFDAVQTPDRIDISSGASLGIFGTNSLSVFFRGDGSGNASIFNGTTDTPIQSIIPSFNTGITGAGQWNNYAVRYDQVDQEIELYVNEDSKGVIDLTTFAGGIYQGFSNAVVGVGAGDGAGDRTWTDNFQVGGAMPPPVPHPDPGNIANPPSNLVAFYDFNEANGPVQGNTLNFAYDRVGSMDGVFQGTATRTDGIVGHGAAQYNNVLTDAVNIGNSLNLTGADGITLETIFTSNWDGLDQAEFFRKEDGNSRILLSFQRLENITNDFGQLVGDENFPGISLGINVNGAYEELDVAFDGQDGRPTLAEVSDGNPHHLAATYDATTGVKSIYLDGVLIGSFSYGGAASLTTGGATDAYIGNYTSNSEPFDGVLDEFAIYNSALSLSDIQAHIGNVLAGNDNYFIPEPSSFALLTLAMAAGISRRRKNS